MDKAENKMIKIAYKNRVYHIEKEKLIIVIEKLSGKVVLENEIEKYLEKFDLYDEYFLKNVNKL